MRKSILILVLFMLPLALAHKDAAISSGSAGDYEVKFGLNPANAVELKPQHLFVKILEDNLPAPGLEVIFSIYPTNLEEEKITLIAEEQRAGHYAAEFQFTSKGNYQVEAQIFQNNNQITQLTKNVHVEPNGPSLYFWVFMFLALLIGIIISRGNKW